MRAGSIESARRFLADCARHYLARLHRARLHRTVFIAISGSAGKTTTKAISAAILSTHAHCSESPGTGNEHRDIERAVLSTSRSARFGILEMGAPEPGYLDRSLRVVRPDIVVLTRIAREHYSAYRSLEAIAAEKSKLVHALPSSGIAVLNRDDPLIRAIGERCGGHVVWIGHDAGATVRLLECRSNWPDPLTLRLGFLDRIHEVRTNLHGTHLATPVIAALGVAVAAGRNFVDAVDCLERVEPVQGRMQVETTGGVAFVRDDWKAPQWSFPAPLEFLRDARAQRKVVVVGSISDSPKSPSVRCAWAAKQSLAVADVVIAIGARLPDALHSTASNQGKLLCAFPTLFEAAQFLRNELRPGDLVLLKGTNKQDHLVRLMIDRQRPVRCWEMRCGRNEFCGSCAHVHAAPPRHVGRAPSGEPLLADFHA